MFCGHDCDCDDCDSDCDREQVRKPPCCPDGHMLQFVGVSEASDWYCDGWDGDGDCKLGMFASTSWVPRYQCEECNFDVCNRCYDAMVMYVCYVCMYVCMRVILIRCVSGNGPQVPAYISRLCFIALI
jgi:hypothetical protein